MALITDDIPFNGKVNWPSEPEVATSLSEAAGALEALAHCSVRLAETAARLHDARQHHEAASREFAAAHDRLAKAREAEAL